MRVIFLDFDGVIVCGKGKDAHHPYPPAISALNDLIRSTKSKIVVSSCWRIGWTTELLQKTLTEFGADCEVIGKTKSNIHREDGKHCTRGEEITEWINDQGPKFKVTDYIVVDDEICDMTNLPRDKILYVEDGWMKGGLTQELVNMFLYKSIK